MRCAHRAGPARLGHPVTTAFAAVRSRTAPADRDGFPAGSGL